MQDGELVAAEAGHGVRLAHAGAQALGYVPEHRIAGGVAQRVVDALEPVQVEAHDSKRQAAAELRNGGLQPFVEREAVRQTRERVMPGQIDDPLVAASLFGDVLVGYYPTAVRQRLVRHVEHTAGRQVERVAGRPSLLDNFHSFLDSLLRSAPRVGALLRKGQDDFTERDARRDRARRKPEQVQTSSIEQQQLAGDRIKHDALRHVGERHVEMHGKLRPCLLVGLQPVLHGVEGRNDTAELLAGAGHGDAVPRPVTLRLPDPGQERGQRADDEGAVGVEHPGQHGQARRQGGRKASEQPTCGVVPGAAQRNAQADCPCDLGRSALHVHDREAQQCGVPSLAGLARTCDDVAMIVLHRGGGGVGIGDHSREQLLDCLEAQAPQWFGQGRGKRRHQAGLLGEYLAPRGLVDPAAIG